MKRTYAILALVFLLCLFSLAYFQNLEIHFINVGQGDSILVKTPDDRTIFV